MNKIGIFRIGFVEQNEIDDTWHEQEQPAQRGVYESVLPNSRWFKSIDQTASTIAEQTVDEADGICYEASLQFVVRKDTDMELAKRYALRPVVVYVEAVDGHTYKLGTKEYPVRMAIANSYDAMNTRQVTVSANYRTLTGIMQG